MENVDYAKERLQEILIRENKQVDILRQVNYGGTETYFENYFDSSDMHYAYEEIDYQLITYNEVLVECDYCGSHFNIDRTSRIRRINSFIKSSPKYGLIELYKDACRKCMFKKREETHMIRFGTHTLFTTERVRRKARLGKLRIGGVYASKQQNYIAKITGGKINVLIGMYVVDVLLKNNIIIEYDGGGHDLVVKLGGLTEDQFNERERFRENYLIEKGYKIVRIVSPLDFLPSANKLIELINNEVSNLSDSNVVYIHIPTRKTDRKYGKLYEINKLVGKEG